MFDFDNHIKKITTLNYEECDFLKDLIIKSDLAKVIDTTNEDTRKQVLQLYEKLITIQNCQRVINNINKKN